MISKVTFFVEHGEDTDSFQEFVEGVNAWLRLHHPNEWTYQVQVDI